MKMHITIQKMLNVKVNDGENFYLTFQVQRIQSMCTLFAQIKVNHLKVCTRAK